MRYGSVCSGIEAATVAWHPLGWQPAFFSEIEAFPRAVLAHHYPSVALHGDFTTIGADDYGPIDLLVGGTPCQSFSIAGLRGGLDDDRGNLALEFLRLADRKRPRWLVWENVPGVLSSNGGRDFGSILGGLAELGYGFAYRILDAQFFGVPQRRRRVFVVGHLGDWRRAAAVLFERHSLQGNPAPRREKGQVAPTVPCRSTGGGGLGTDFDCDGGLIRWPAETAPTLNAAFGSKQGLEDQHIRGGAGCSSLPRVAMCLNAGAMGRQDAESETLIPVNRCGFDDVTHSLRGECFDASEDGTGRETPLVPCYMATDYRSGAFDLVGLAGPVTASADRTRAAPVVFDTTQVTSPANYSNPQPGDPCHPLAAGQHPPAIAFTAKDYGADAMDDCSPTLRAGGFDGSHANGGVMPRCERVAYAIQERAVSENLENGPQGKGYQEGVAYTLEARNKVQSVAASAVRRLTPKECARLQGFPDEYLDITYRNKPAADGPKYKALGNSMAVPVMRWIGERIAMVEAFGAREAA
jgi:DNA (cytosine-5)-methyltransferase 1